MGCGWRGNSGENVRAPSGIRSFCGSARRNSLLNGAIRGTIHHFGFLRAPKAGVFRFIQVWRLDCIQRPVFLDGRLRIADYFCC